jgi:flavorubredoxin
MAEAVVKGAKSSLNIIVDLSYHVEVNDLLDYDAILVGAPTYRAQMPIDFKNLFEEAKAKGISLQGKIAAVFGSYGWSGEAPQAVVEALKNLGAQVTEPPIKARLNPDQKTLDDCEGLGKRVAEKISNAT